MGNSPSSNQYINTNDHINKNEFDIDLRYNEVCFMVDVEKRFGDYLFFDFLKKYMKKNNKIDSAIVFQKNKVKFIGGFKNEYIQIIESNNKFHVKVLSSERK